MIMLLCFSFKWIGINEYNKGPTQGKTKTIWKEINNSDNNKMSRKFLLIQCKSVDVTWKFNVN